MNKLITGFALGLVVGILYAPESGNTTRRRIADKGNDCFCIEHSFHHLVNKNFFGVLFPYTYVIVEYTKFDGIAERC